MAVTAWATNDPRTQKTWLQKYFDYAIKSLMLSGMMGTGPDQPIQIVDKITDDRKKGDKVGLELEIPLSAVGQGDGGRVTDHEEAMVIQNMEVVIHERMHGVVSEGKLSEKRTVTNFRELAMRQLKVWSKNVAQEPDLIAALFGLYNASGIGTVNEVLPSANRLVYGGQTVGGVVSAATMTSDALLSAETAASTLCGLQFLSVIRRRAMMATPRIRPLNVNGMDCYKVLIHPYCKKAIVQSTGEQAFIKMLTEAEQKGKGNPVLSGGPFFYDGMFIQEYDRCPLRIGAGGTGPSEGFWLNALRTATTDPVADTKKVAAGLLLGCQAAVFVPGAKPEWVEDWVDGNIPWAKTHLMYATKKVQFNVYDATGNTNTAQEDYGVIQFHNQVIVD